VNAPSVGTLVALQLYTFITGMEENQVKERSEYHYLILGTTLRNTISSVLIVISSFTTHEIGEQMKINRKKLRADLLRLKKKKGWSWERMCREFHRVIGYEGVVHTTLWRVSKARGKPQHHNLAMRFIREGIDLINKEGE